MRETEISFVETYGGNFSLICSLATREDTQILNIDRYTGRICYEGIFGKDLFNSSKDAFQKINGDQKCVKNSTKMKAIIGYFVLGPSSYVLGVINNRSDLTLPKEHKIYSVTETRWFKIPLGYPITISSEEQKRADMLLKIDLNNNYFYCDTGLDLTKPFPYCYPNLSADENASIHLEHCPEFCWNDFLAKEMKSIGMREWCCFLIQGFAKSKPISISSSNSDSTTPTNQNDANANFNFALIARKIWLNPNQNELMGGLNAFACPPNEFEFEQILWRDSTSSGICTWCSHYWRSGSTPVHWKIEKNQNNSQIPNNNGNNDAGNITMAKKPFKECNHYYDRLRNRFSRFFFEKKPKITIVDALKNNDVYGESQLKDVFNSSLQTLEIQDPAIVERMELEKTDFLWDNTAAAITTTNYPIISAKIAASQKMNGFSSGMFKFGKKDGFLNSSSAQNPLPQTSQPKITEFKSLTTQKGFFRFSCLDGLERSFFGGFCLALNVFYEQCRSLGVGLRNEALHESMNEAFMEPWFSFDFPFDTLKKIVKPGLTKGFSELFYAFFTQFCSYNTNYNNYLNITTTPIQNAKIISNSINQSPFGFILRDTAGIGILVPIPLNNWNPESNYQNYMFLGINSDLFFPSTKNDPKMV